jgi:zinc transporter
MIRARSDVEVKLEAAESGYGSDKHGLVWGYRFDPGEPAVPIDCGEAAAWLASADRASSDSFVWLHFSLSNRASEDWFRSHLTLPDGFLTSLREEIGSTRVEQDADALVAVMHDVAFDFSFDPSAVSTVNLCLGPHLFLSARRRPLRSVDQLRVSVKSGAAFRSTTELLAHLLRDQANVLVDIVRQTSRRVDGIEDALLADRIAASRPELGSQRRTLVRLQRLLAPEPAALFRLLNRPPGWIRAEDAQDLRQAAEEFSTAVSDAGEMIERIRSVQEELAARIGERSSRTLYVLTLCTVLALPINLAAGLFGMNVGGIPFADHPLGFFAIVALLVALTGLLAYLALARGRE